MIPHAISDEKQQANGQEGFIRLALVAPFLRYLHARGLDLEPTFDAFGLTGSQVAQRDMFVHSEIVFGLLDALATLAGDRHLGAHVGETFDLSGWPPFAAALPGSETLAAFLTRFVQHVPGESSAVRHRLIIEADTAAYHVARLQDPAVPPVQVTGFGAAIYVRLLQTVVGPAWDPARVTVESRYVHGVPAGYHGVETRLSADPGLMIGFPPDWLFLPLRMDRGLRAPAPPPAAEELTLIAALRAALRDHLETPRPTPEDVAALLGLDPARLQRALRQAGTSLPREIRRLRTDLAKEALATTARPITQIGQSLGYPDRAHFTRFFRTQTGMTPSQYRAGQRAETG